MYLYFKTSRFVFQIACIYLILSCISLISTNIYLNASTLMRKIVKVFTKNIGSLFSLWYQNNKNSNEFVPKKKKATPSLPKYPSHLNLVNFVSLKFTSTNYHLWEIQEPYHLMKVKLLVPMKMAKSLNQTWRHGHVHIG